MADNEQLMRAALHTIETLKVACGALIDRVEVLESKLAKARGTEPPALQEAITKALGSRLASKSAGGLIAQMAKAQSERLAREGMTREERTEDSLRKLRELKS